MEREPPGSNNQANENDSDYSDSDLDEDVEGEYYSDSTGSYSDSDDASTVSSEPHEDPQDLPRPPTPPPPPNDPPPPREVNEPSTSSKGETCTTENLASGSREHRDDLDEDSIVQIIIPQNIHTATIY